MLSLTIKANDELWDAEKQEFVKASSGTLVLEHSLLSISKWESKYHKPFLSKLEKDKKTPDEMLDYIRCMTINSVNPDIYYGLTNDQIKQIGDYIGDSMTATTVTDRSRYGKAGSKNGEIVTSELIYYWMVVHGIPFECQKWHLNRLLTLVQVCNVKNAPAKNMSRKDIMAQNKALNAMRRAKHKSRG